MRKREGEESGECRQSNTIIDAVELSLAPKVMKGIIDKRKLLVAFCLCVRLKGKMSRPVYFPSSFVK